MAAENETGFYNRLCFSSPRTCRVLFSVDAGSITAAQRLVDTSNQWTIDDRE
jgi:hypothetical protein